MYVNEEQFVELVRRGHSLVKFRTEFTRMETLASVIEVSYNIAKNDLTLALTER